MTPQQLLSGLERLLDQGREREAIDLVSRAYPSLRTEFDDQQTGALYALMEGARSVDSLKQPRSEPRSA